VAHALEGIAVLAWFWQQRPFAKLVDPARKKDDAEPAPRTTLGKYVAAAPDDLHLWFRMAEDFVAADTMGFLSTAPR
jgi:hypothetical protein